jgi:uncharacterized membrane protein YecN with MAPEG domain
MQFKPAYLTIAFAVKVSVLFAGIADTTFLKVSYEPVATRMKKQNLASLPETIDNYAQLKSYFRQTRWNIFFE